MYKTPFNPGGGQNDNTNTASNRIGLVLIRDRSAVYVVCATDTVSTKDGTSTPSYFLPPSRLQKLDSTEFSDQRDLGRQIATGSSFCPHDAALAKTQGVLLHSLLHQKAEGIRERTDVVLIEIPGQAPPNVISVIVNILVTTAPAAVARKIAHTIHRKTPNSLLTRYCKPSTATMNMIEGAPKTET